MITKIKKIKNIGSFFYFDWDSVNPSLKIDSDGNPILDKNGTQKKIMNDFKKINVLFGENGTGKTTLVKLLKTLNSDSDIYINKNWNHENESCSFDINTDSTSIQYSDSGGIQGNLFKDKILFFDRDYIDNFVHSFPSGRASNHNKNTGNLILYLGNFFQYKNQLSNLSQLKNLLQDKNKNIENKIYNNFEKLKSLGSFNEIKETFNNITPSELSDLPNNIVKQTEKVEEMDKKIKEIDKKIEKTEEISKIESPTKIGNIDSIDQDDIDNAFEFSISTAAAKAMSTISGREDFIREGVQIIHDHKLDECPFCQQSIKGDGKYIETVNQYKEIFDETFKNEQKKTRDSIQSYRNKIINILGLRVSVQNNSLVTKINNLLSLEFQMPDIVLSEEDKIFLEKELEKTELKQSDITKTLKSNANRIVFLIDELNERINLYNQKIRDIQIKLADAQAEVSSGNLPAKKEVLQRDIIIEKFKLFTYVNYSSLKDIFNTELILEKNKTTIDKIGDIFDIARKNIEELFQVFVKTYFSEIEKNMSIFCPSLELKVIGSNPRYDLRMGSVGDVTCGLEVHYKNKDRLKDLSEGEKQSIALSYFLAFLNKEIDKKNKIVVFDDPINSFDSGRRKQAAELIYKESINFRQLFIFTCDSLFKSYCLKLSNKHLGDKRNFYYLLKSASSSVHFRPREYQTVYSSFKQDFLNIGFVKGTEDMIVVYGQKLRYCLEEIKDRHLGYSEDKFEDILIAVETGKISNLINKINEIRELYSYCNTGGLAHFPKDGQTSWVEIKSQIDKYLKLNL